MNRFVIITMVCLLLFSAIGYAQETELIEIGSYFEGFTVIDAQIIAQEPYGGQEIYSYSLIKEQYNLGLDGEGKEDALLATETMQCLRLSAIEQSEDVTSNEEYWHFSISIVMEAPVENVRECVQRNVVLSFYDFNRLSKLAVMETKRDENKYEDNGTEGSTVIVERWCEIPIEALRIFEDLYLRRVCALFPDWSSMP